MSSRLFQEHGIEARKEGLFLEGVSLEALAERYGTPLYVYSATAMRTQARTLLRALHDLPATPCYAVKANSNLAILRLFAEEGLGADIVSGGELERCIRARIEREKIVFSGVGKQAWEIQRALEVGIHSFNIESPAEFDLIEKISSQNQRSCRVAIRFNPDVDAKTHPYISTGLRENKFGLHLKETLALAERARSSRWVQVSGISVHIGSQMLSLAPLKEAFESTRKLMTRIEKILGRRLDWIDVGGGLGIPYTDKTKPVSIESYAKLIRTHFQGYSVYLEPGRWLVGNAGLLLSKVIYRKTGHKKDYLIIDGAMNDLMRPSLYEAHHEIVPVGARNKKSALIKTDVVGPVCETGDFLGQGRKLSRAIQEGDVLAILSAGAYGFSMSSHYNTRKRCAEILVENGKSKIIRRKETWEDLFAPELI